MVAITFEQKDRQTRQKTLKIREDLPTEHTENAKVFQKFFGVISCVSWATNPAGSGRGWQTVEM